MLFIDFFSIELLIIVFLAFISCAGILLNTHNLLILLIYIELLMLSGNFGFLIFSVNIDDLFGEVFSLFILAVTGAESTIGLAIIIIFFRIRNTSLGAQEPVLKR